MEGPPLTVENEDDEESRRKKELEERQDHEKKLKKPENIGFLAVESEPEEPSALQRAWAETARPKEEESDKDPEESAEVPPVIIPLPALERPVVETETAPVSEPETEPAEVGTEAEPIVPAGEEQPGSEVPQAVDEAAETGLEPELPAPAEAEAFPEGHRPEAHVQAPEADTEEAPEPPAERQPEIAREASDDVTESAPEPYTEELPAEPAPTGSEELRIDHAAEAESETEPAEVGTEAEPVAAAHEESPDLQAEPEAIPAPEAPIQAGTEAPAEDEEVTAPEQAAEPEPESEPAPATEMTHEAVAAEADHEEAGELVDERPFEFTEGGADEDQEEAVSEQPVYEAEPAARVERHEDEEERPAAASTYQTVTPKTELAPELTRSSRAAEEKMRVESAPKGPLAGRNVESLTGEELLDIAGNLTVDGENLRQIYEAKLIGERGLRRLIYEYQRGGDLRSALQRELLEHEMDFERDPAMRDIAATALASQDADTAGNENPELDDMLKKAGAAAAGSGHHAVAHEVHGAGTGSQGRPRKAAARPRQNHRTADAILLTVITTLIVAIVFIYLTR